LANIAIEVERAVADRRQRGAAGQTKARVIAEGAGWTVADVVCSCGPEDRPFEETHQRFSIALVASGTFQYRSRAGAALMTPGSLMIGTPGQCFECGHEHASGDRCVSIWYDGDYFERLAADAGWRGPLRVRVPRVPPVRALSPVVSRIVAGLARPDAVAWDEVALALAPGALAWIADHRTPPPSAPPGAVARVTRALRAIDRGRDRDLPLSALAAQADLSPFHFLRTFEQQTGLTPHQYIRRARLRDAAARLLSGDGKVVDAAFECGFGDESNYNRSIRKEFGVSPKQFRTHAASKRV
jgi:AraC-like DNA-binding protein